MSSASSALRLSRAVVFATVCGALACALALTPTPALAHDALKSSSPAKNAQVSAASLEEIELEYTASVKFPFVVLHDAKGAQVPLGKPRLAGPKVIADVTEPLAPGPYVIAWRVVSSDGHPIEGEIPFRVKGSPSPAPTTGESTISASQIPSPPSWAAGSPAPAAEPPPAGGTSPAASAGVPGWIWGGLAALVVLGAFVLLRGARRGPERGNVNAD
ncbi:copper resistance CopC family protein [Nonomuraea turkmeniaca]|uniref:copper resistance CopC family protein n=1 Tax=Nonomuraea turkmeniaca TaxID=103838 RepID=UPI001476A652|nr:copper resistance protein CopC [Nonomuraea turkmeniaca]